jgi:DNA-binding LacI/PurR family transcriptional regulator
VIPVVAANHHSSPSGAAPARCGGIVLALPAIGDPWGVQLISQVREDALPLGRSTLVLTDGRWYEHLLDARADAALLTGIDLEEDGPDRVRRLAERTRSGLVAFSARMEPDGFDVVSSSPVPAVHQAYARLRARHDAVHFLAPDLASRPGGTFAVPRAAAFLEAVTAHGDGPAESLVHLTPEGGRGTVEAALELLRGPDRPGAVICYTGYQAVALQLAAERAGLRVPDDLELLAIGDVPAAAELLGPISYYGVDDVFARLSAVVVDRAVERGDRPGRLHTFEWDYFPGATTCDGLRDDEEAPCGP